MMYFIYIFTFAFIFFGTNVLINYSLPVMGNIFKEIPNERSSHTTTKLKSGGLFFIFFILISNIIESIFFGLREINQIIFFCSLLALVGLIDDLFLLSAKIRYLMQLIVSFLIVNTIYPNLLLEKNFILLFALLFLGTVTINFINFIDGIDGLLTGCSIPILLFNQFQVLDIQIINILGSLLAFLKRNWEPSKIFMGDCGSNFLGALIFYFILSKDQYFIDFKIFFIILPIFIDCAWCILRRFFNRENIFIAHKKHLYQRLNQSNISHSNVALIYIMICFINFIISFQINLNIFIYISIIEILFLIYLDKSIAKKFN